MEDGAHIKQCHVFWGGEEGGILRVKPCFPLEKSYMLSEYLILSLRHDSQKVEGGMMRYFD
ncbi:hypothetical protein OUZ56_002687 [Daphnia magna]|uniref:Uncharacterized protein n=1 Tax=Daphnia magna TaxID=35525 RepID=A0ABR0A6G9_9CRUS|nr:hypothetical protein OUZ56_002687 [Daphnia magna]